MLLLAGWTRLLFAPFFFSQPFQIGQLLPSPKPPYPPFNTLPWTASHSPTNFRPPLRTQARAQRPSPKNSGSNWPTDRTSLTERG